MINHFKKFKHYIAINAIVINPMEKKKAPFRSIHLKPNVKILHYLLTRIMFPRIINHGFVVREDVVPLWLLTHKISTNWVDGMFNHMIRKEISYVGLSYGPIITKLLANFNIDTMEEVEDLEKPYDLTYTSLKEIRVPINHREIEEDSSFKE